LLDEVVSRLPGRLKDDGEEAEGPDVPEETDEGKS